ncbi:hypothetical protein HG536_0E01680 [Torulaspora globosa]|uniref:SYO1-like TPR repeats domain-containing protein n=1 Tax=Torulaspora globosa TaxID=48254 RepID=A0A7G3ZIC1_9SACH|nr:uncharacterized protein HG536_0E01680 [Torulaspora globosa]QLL33257.1 hypothetical protein HG536_0E01680 [Torulaspora globosa]
MGKSNKRSRASKARLNPIGSGRGEQLKDNGLVKKKLQPLLEKLHSAVPNDRAMALGSITVLCEDPYMRKLLLKERLVQTVLSKLLNDNNTDIVVESFGLLRNISLEEGYDVSTQLWRADIWISIDQGFSKLLESLSALQSAQGQAAKNSSESRRLLFDYADNLLSLVVALANGSDDILRQVLDRAKLERLFEVIIGLLQYGIAKLPLAVLNTVLDLLYDFSSESFQFIEAVAGNEYLAIFVRSLPDQMNTPGFNELTKVLIQGVYLQFLDMDITFQQANDIIHAVCNSIKDIDLEQVNKDLSAVCHDEELVKTKDSQVAQKIKHYTAARSNAMMKLQSIEISIDLITAIIEMIASLSEEKKGPLPNPLRETLMVYLPQVFDKLGGEFTSRILIAWNNLLWLYLTLEINFFKLEGEPYKNLWEFIHSVKEEEIDLKLGKLSVVWALLKTVTMQSEPNGWLSTLQLSNDMDFVNSTIESYNKDMSSSNITREDAIELGQRYCGVLSTYATFQQQIQINEVIGKFILEQLCSTNLPAVLLADYTNSLFEIYGDENFDYNQPVFVQNNFLDILQTKVVPNLRTQFKLVDKNKDPRTKERCTETFNTLDSFIQYKKNE